MAQSTSVDAFGGRALQKAASSAVRLTRDEVAKHCTADDCWLIVNDRVYEPRLQAWNFFAVFVLERGFHQRQTKDVSRFVDEHPAGRSIILMHAGKDCTREFLEVHSEDRLRTAQWHPILDSGESCRTISSPSLQTPSWDVWRARLWGPPSDLPRQVQPAARLLANPAIGARRLLSLGLAQVHFDSSKVLALKREVYNDQHETYRASFRAFLKKHVLPQYTKFESKGVADREIYGKMAKEGYYLTLGIPRACGGLGLDWRHNCVVAEEVEDVGCGGLFVNLGNDMVLSYFTDSCTEQQRARWLPKLIRGAAPDPVGHSWVDLAVLQYAILDCLLQGDCRGNVRARGWERPGEAFLPCAASARWLRLDGERQEDVDFEWCHGGVDSGGMRY